MFKYKSVSDMLLKCIFHFQLNFEGGESHEFWYGDDDDISFEVIIFLNYFFFSKPTVYFRT